MSITNLNQSKPRLLIFIVAYHAESTIASVLSRIPKNILEDYEAEVLIIDDSSKDGTFDKSLDFLNEAPFPFKTTVLYNPENQGYGGNQKIGYQYAIKNEFDFVALIHGDGQYAPECLGALLEPLQNGQAEAVFGSRMLGRREALKGGMPLYKYVGNKILTWFENKMLKSKLSEFHSGYRLYSVKALELVPFELNTNDFHFDTEIIIQFLFAKLRIVELPIPTYYGDEICRVNGMKYALDVVISVVFARLQSAGLFYKPNFDCVAKGNTQYVLKLDYQSPHSEVFKRVLPGSRVLDLGCAGGYVGAYLKAKLGCYVVGVDYFPLGDGILLDEFIRANLDDGIPEIDLSKFDYILMLDVIEHLHRPEKFLEQLHQMMSHNLNTKIIASTGNIAFFVQRLMLLFGQFNYGKRGILDMTHTRLFTSGSFSRLFKQSGFQVITSYGIPAPFPLAIGNNFLSRLLLKVNTFFIRLAKGLFSYQIFIEAKAIPSLYALLYKTMQESKNRLIARSDIPSAH